MKTKKVIFLIMLTICLILSGCSKKSQETSVPGDISKTPPNSEINKSDDAINKSYPDSETWEPEVIQRQFLFDEGYLAGVIFLGYVDGSKEKRKRLLTALELPERMSTASLVKVLNSFVTYEEFIEKAKEIED